MAYQHKEAFCLMWYGCPCGHRERIWNSRDGVTPFGGILCPSCNSTAPRPLRPDANKLERAVAGHPPGMEHMYFGSDVCCPEWKPAPGQRIWRDGTPDEAVAIMERRFKIFAEKGHPAPDDVRESLIAHARNGTEEWRAGWPTLERTPDR
jgi:hypothetical protein